MKIRLGNLKRLIRETITDVIDPGTTPVSDDEFDAIVLSEQRKITETLEMINVCLSSLLGLAIIGASLGKAYLAARNLYDTFNNIGKNIANEKANNAMADGSDEQMNQLNDDPHLAGMIDDLAAMRGVATAEDVRGQTSMINSYIKKKVSYTDQVRSGRQPRNH